MRKQPNAGIQRREHKASKQAEAKIDERLAVERPAAMT